MLIMVRIDGMVVTSFCADASCSINTQGSQHVYACEFISVSWWRGGGVDFPGHRQELPERRSRSPNRDGGEDPDTATSDPAWECKGASPLTARCVCMLCIASQLILHGGIGCMIYRDF